MCHLLPTNYYSTGSNATRIEVIKRDQRRHQEDYISPYVTKQHSRHSLVAADWSVGATRGTGNHVQAVSSFWRIAKAQYWPTTRCDHARRPIGHGADIKIVKMRTGDEREHIIIIVSIAKWKPEPEQKCDCHLVETIKSRSTSPTIQQKQQKKIVPSSTIALPKAHRRKKYIVSSTWSGVHILARPSIRLSSHGVVK